MIQAYSVIGEILTTGQNFTGLHDALGNQIYLSPDISLSDIFSNLGTFFVPKLSKQLHDIDEVIQALEKRIRECCK